MPAKVQKESLITGVTSVIVSWVSILVTVWLVVKPALIMSVSDAIALDITNTVTADITSTVAEEVEPLNSAFLALIQSNIDRTKREIARYRYREQTDQNWSAEDASHLADLKIELAALEEAKEKLNERRTAQ